MLSAQFINALKWALFEDLFDAGFVSELHIILESVRNANDIILKDVATWLRQRVCFTPMFARPAAESLRERWSTFSLELEVAELFLDRRTRWDGNRFCVADTFFDDPDLMEDFDIGIDISVEVPGIHTDQMGICWYICECHSTSMFPWC